MNEIYERVPVRTRRNALYEIVLLIVFVFIGLFVGYFVGVFLVLIFIGFDINLLQSVLLNPTENPESRNIILALQAIPSIGAFIVAPLFFMRFIAKQPTSALNSHKQIWLVPALLCALLIIAFMPLNAFFIEWNNQMNLPGWLDGVENWMKDKENALKELTEYLTNFDTVPQLVIGLIVIALIPAIGEELLFRGLLQPRVYRLTKNMHAAIWITGFIFSAIHMQFYGLIPRMLLGVLFGYVYVWSGNLWYPIIGHFVNNGFTLLMIYLYRLKIVDINIEGTSAVPVGTSIFSLAFCATLILALKQYYFKNRTSPGI
jgi:uncharacterized protein